MSCSFLLLFFLLAFTILPLASVQALWTSAAFALTAGEREHLLKSILYLITFPSSGSYFNFFYNHMLIVY